MKHLIAIALVGLTVAAVAPVGPMEARAQSRAAVPMGAGAVWCGIATALCLVACGGLRRRWGYLVGWAAQAAIVALGVLTPWMYAMGLIFALIWVTCIVLGRRIETKQQGSAS